MRVEGTVPHAFEDRRLGDHAPLVAQEVFKELVFKRLEADGLTCARDLVRDKVHFEVARAQDGLGIRRGAAQHGLHAHDHLGNRKRLGDIVVASSLKTRNTRIHATAGTQHHDGQLAAGGAQAADELQPVHLRQHDVHDCRVKGTMLRLQKPVLAVGRARRAEARLPESPGDELRDLRVVFNDQHVHGAAVPR